ncbi:class A beta-lactamase-related serine hydrolase [Nocardia yamanashiensis]|uniref:serine hydrolase n=1 Tax=Nocardia yamanashiensis TaxID=209247 RepID=UPI001E36D09F|nr:serine hydrolase [Nocardia yamanashiensis]UGT42706.1 class A beta-lactamase-related serine hydrolase [Nocardia yamanashiensis]
MEKITRRTLLAASTIAAGGLLGAGVAGAEPSAAGGAFDAEFRAVARAAGGRWHAYVTELGSGERTAVVEEDADFVIEGASVQKLAVMAGVMAEVDAGRLRLTDTTTLDEASIMEGSGIYLNQPAFGDQVTVAGLLTSMLQVSDNTAVRLLARFVPGETINGNLAKLGFEKTRVEVIPGEERFYLGVTTPRENNDLLYRLASGTLLSKDSTQAILRVMSWSGVGYTDGVRRYMSSGERARFATKFGAADDRRHETGVMFDENGAPLLAFSFFADRAPDAGNYGGTNPIVAAHAALGRFMIDTYKGLSPLRPYVNPKVIAGGH